MGNQSSVPTPTVPRSATAPAHGQSTVLNEKMEAMSLVEGLSSPDRRCTTTEGKISASETHAWVHRILEDPKNRLALSALSTANPAHVLQIPSAIIKDAQVFNTAIPLEGSPVTNQRQSGRCWIFAATNVFRIAIMKKYNISHLELSQNYLFFWDKVEKANFFLESILDTTNKPVDSRVVSQLLSSPVGDGGQWDMIANLVSKYGLVPQTLYPDTWNAQTSSVMDQLITTKLREDALKLRQLASEGADASSLARKKDKQLQEIVRILTLTLGPPPARDEKLGWQFYDKNGKLRTLDETPLELAAGLSDSKSVRACGGTDVHRLFSLVNDPRNEYNRLLTVDRLGNVYGGRPVTYVNVEMQVLKQAAIAMIKKGLPVFFGSDVGKYSDSTKGIMDINMVDYELGFNVRLGMKKAQRLQTGESQMTHAMVLTAVHLDADGQPVRWRVENSWSDVVGERGYFVASDAWMDEFCYQAVVDPIVVSEEVKKVLEQKPKVLPLWDPMGALA